MKSFHIIRIIISVKPLSLAFCRSLLETPSSHFTTICRSCTRIAPESPRLGGELVIKMRLYTFRNGELKDSQAMNGVNYDTEMCVKLEYDKIRLTANIMFK